MIPICLKTAFLLDDKSKLFWTLDQIWINQKLDMHEILNKYRQFISTFHAVKMARTPFSKMNWINSKCISICYKTFSRLNKKFLIHKYRGSFSQLINSTERCRPWALALLSALRLLQWSYLNNLSELSSSFPKSTHNFPK